MALEAAFQDLHTQTQKLHAALLGLRLTIVEDKPLKDDAALVDRFADGVEDVLGWAREACAAAEHGRKSSHHPVDAARAARSLVACHERANLIMHKLLFDLMSYRQVDDLKRLGRERGGEWRAWSVSAREALDKCGPPSYDLSYSLFLCWREIAERVGMASLSVQATNIGQQITAAESRELAQREIP
ncbi:MAG TPA: hypothetical protein VM409_08710 [Chloroflexia bacterium]|nr:hypothetical protein [Chloroflexia bacterium]